MEALGDRLKVMVKVFRRECHRVLHSERTTIHGADGMLMLLQLAMADINKQHGGEFKVALSDVLMAWKHLLLDKLHLPPPNFARLENYDLILEAYESFLKRSNTVDLVDILSMYKQLRVEETDPGEPVSPVELFKFLSGNTEVSELPDSSVPSTPSSKSRPCSSQVKTAVRRVFCSYLNLLVNIKNDLALALTLDVPSRTLGRQAFTDIKHAAQNNNTSLFLAVTSFVRAIQLGGKGYAPAESDPLRKHVKGLSDFVQFLDNLEEILGEIPDPSVCGARLVTAVRAALVKGRSSGEAVYAAAEETTKELKERICQLHQIQKQIANGSGTGISPARPKPYAVNHCTAYGGRDTVKVLMALLDEEALTPPCQNKADLLSEDQPVLSGAEGTCVLDLFSLETKSFDPSLRAHTKMKNCHSTGCWSSPAPARSQPVCTQHPNSKPSQLWMKTAALMWSSQPKPSLHLNARIRSRAACSGGLLWRQEVEMPKTEVQARAIGRKPLALRRRERATRGSRWSQSNMEVQRTSLQRRSSSLVSRSKCLARMSARPPVRRS
ncbi:PCNA-interacting partner isoform X2 [Epinephelus moara]|uniref:PCNA-interacting partner isoform X2 n=1 Tax=Epinephelus moara TaxID=300413 RepID=UPI00214E800E|nr:PCNA-interacting partner isoform X2 [Epinephelus moara]